MDILVKPQAAEPIRRWKQKRRNSQVGSFSRPRGVRRWRETSKSQRKHSPHRIHGTGIFTYIRLMFMVRVGKYTIHGSYGVYTINCMLFTPNKTVLENPENYKDLVDFNPFGQMCSLQIRSFHQTFEEKQFKNL